MPQLVVTANKLNKRRVIPTVLPDPNNIVGQVFRDHDFEGDEVAVVPNPSLGKWYVDRDGFFYWGGGVMENVTAQSSTDIDAPALAEEVQPQEKISYQKFIDYLNNAWLKGNGKNTTIVLIDTGVSAIASKFNIDFITEIDITDGTSADKDHGTFIAGLLCGKNNQLTGLANEANLISIRYKNDKTKLGKLLDNLIIALDKVIRLKQQNPGLNLCVNMSLGLDNDQRSMFPEKIVSVTNSIQALVTQNVLVFCAAGENEHLLDGNLLFPALLPETISVGCIISDKMNLPFSKKIDFITPLQEYRSYNTILEIVPDSGSSFSVAIMTSISLLINSVQPVHSKSQFKTLLEPHKRDIQNFKFNNTEYEFFMQ